MKGDGERDDTSISQREIERATVSITSPAALSYEPSIPTPGTLISGKYRVESMLGQGGMGVVLAAMHVRLERKVALKLLRPGAHTDRRALRLLREAQSTSRLRSPYVAELFDVEELADRTPCLVLERLEGETLAERLRRSGPLSVAEAADFLVQAALGLAAAHAAGVIHRDVKPSNLFLTRSRDGAPLVKVLDFGIAKLAAGSDVTLTGDAGVLGSPAYMSPEQTRGARNVDLRTDIWALGVTLFELVSGHLPFEGGQAQAVAARVAADAPRSLAELCPECPRGVVQLVKRCLEKNPDRRCSSTTDFVRALAPFGSEASAPRVAEAVALALPRPRRVVPRAVLGVATALLLASAGVFVVGRSWRNLPTKQGDSKTPAVAATAPARPLAFRDLKRVTFDEGCEEFPWWAPDNKTIVFDGASEKESHVFTLDVDSGARKEVTRGSGWQIAPSLSPNGGLVAYLVLSATENSTYVSKLDGSERKRLSTTDVVRPSWSPDGSSVWLGGSVGPMRVDVASGEINRRLKPPDASSIFNILEFPDGRIVGRATVRDGKAGLVIYPSGKDEGGWLWRADVESVLEIAPDGASVLAAKVTESGATELYRVPLDGATPERVAGSEILPTKGFHLSPDGRRAVWSTCRELHQIADLTKGDDAGALALKPEQHQHDWVDETPINIPNTSAMLMMSTRTGHLMPCVVDMSEHEPARCLDIGSLAATRPWPSPDGLFYTFDAQAKAIYVAPLDGSAAPRKLAEARAGERQQRTSISPDGKDVYFTVTTTEGKTHIEKVPVEGGTPTRFLEDGTRNLSFSPKGDVAAFLLGERIGKSVPMLLDLRTGKRRPLSPELKEASFSRVTFSGSGDRAAFVQANVVTLVEVASGKVVARLDGGNEQFEDAAFRGENLTASHTLWNGDIWIAAVDR